VIDVKTVLDIIAFGPTWWRWKWKFRLGY